MQVTLRTLNSTGPIAESENGLGKNETRLAPSRPYRRFIFPRRAAGLVSASTSERLMSSKTRRTFAGRYALSRSLAMCHDHPSGRTPPKSIIADHTPAYLEAIMREGIMSPMAQGLGWPQTAAIATYLATRRSGSVGTSAMEAPTCSDKPAPLTLAKPGWNGWGAEPTQQRFQSDPGLTAADVPRLKLKWAMAFVGGRYGQATIVGGRLFLNSSSGAVYSLNSKTGCAYWRFDADAATRSTIVIGELPSSMSPARFAAYFTDYSHSALRDRRRNREAAVENQGRRPAGGADDGLASAL